MNWNKKLQKGMSFLEVVVAMLVIGVALAGSLAMIQASNRFALTAEFTSIAQQKAQDLIDKMRVNSTKATEFITYDTVFERNKRIDYPALYKQLYEANKSNNNIDLASVKSKVSSKESCIDANTCTEEDFVAFELYAWLSALQQELEGSVPVIQPATTAKNSGVGSTRKNEFVISILWKVNHEGDGNNIQGISVPFSI